jgi:hypothetical protein
MESSQSSNGPSVVNGACRTPRTIQKSTRGALRIVDGVARDALLPVRLVLDRFLAFVESYEFWRVFPWVVSLSLVVVANFFTLLYALRYFAFSDALMFTW